MLCVVCQNPTEQCHFIYYRYDFYAFVGVKVQPGRNAKNVRYFCSTRPFFFMVEIVEMIIFPFNSLFFDPPHISLLKLLF
jgi:hypothetical protein